MKASRLVRLMVGLWVGGLVLLVCVVGVVASWLLTQAVWGEEVVEAEPMVNRIALIGNDGNVWVAAPDKEEAQRVTTDGAGYQFPTWAPDGRRLAFIGPDDEGAAALYLLDGAREDPTILFSNSDAAPFYIYWSPDSRSVSFLTQELSSLSMRLADANNPGTDRVLATGAPFYWVWSPNGDRLLMHVGGARSSSEDAHLSFLDNSEDANRVELMLAPGHFQAPVWSASGQYVFYIAAGEDDADAIYRTDVDSRVQTLIAQLDRPAFIVLSPDDRHIAYLQIQSVARAPALGTAYIVGIEGENRRQLLSDWVAAMYWSPDGKKLALLTATTGDDGSTARAFGLAAPVPRHARFRWWVYHVDTDTMEPLISFVPTLDFLQTVPYFDQYHLSLTFWSPDSRYFVIAKGESNTREGTVWVLDTTGEVVPRQVGEGTLGVWSWR